MNKIRYLLISWALLFPLAANSQHIIPEISLGWGDYNMKELKEMQSAISGYYPVRLKSVNSFPPYYFYKASLFYAIDKFQFGFSWSHYSTGARDHYKDYSGEISVKQLIHTNVFSFPFLVRINQEKRFNFFFSLEPGIMHTKYVMLEEVRILSESNRDKYSDYSNSLSLQPSLKFSYSLGRWQPSINMGYFFDTKITVETEDTEIIFNKDESKYSDFSGVRFWVSLAYKIN